MYRGEALDKVLVPSRAVRIVCGMTRRRRRGTRAWFTQSSCLVSTFHQFFEHAEAALEQLPHFYPCPYRQIQR
ncbi:uncharacterized protein BKA55DRAFT_166366 [Fusarium redolens]|uniref:Uncharacterized protein n=1 Tax=Fusarium redolens TaxID=48865 RepID=A0A9P9KRE7_FUSRE|nr:uncharacterized protein BKA55DRAFT_166366 [Fusarium redolens]KAH7267161.1 hypothetical protein BKA55DRAFT_166366 [Fusarium redolens]